MYYKNGQRAQKPMISLTFHLLKVVLLEPPLCQNSQKKLMCTIKLRYITEHFEFLQRVNVNQLQRNDQKCGISCHSRPNFTRMSLRYIKLNLNETSFRGLQKSQTFWSSVLQLSQKIPNRPVSLLDISIDGCRIWTIAGKSR